MCKTLRNGNWTVEREEDMTGPYAFDDIKSWMSFDDATSLIIKTKYAILRNLGGMALFSIDADDVDNNCGQGELSLLKAIFKTMTKLGMDSNNLSIITIFGQEHLYTNLIAKSINFPHEKIRSICIHI